MTGRELSAHRSRFGLKRGPAVAEVAGVHIHTISKWEARGDDLIPDGYAAQRLERFFGHLQDAVNEVAVVA